MGGGRQAPDGTVLCDCGTVQVAEVSGKSGRSGVFCLVVSTVTNLLAGSGNLGKFVATLRGHVGPVYRLTWSADSRMVVSASKDSTVKVNLFRYPVHLTNLPARYGTSKLTN